MFFEDKKEKSSDFLIKLIIFLGAVSAIFVAVALLIKKYRKKVNIDSLNELDFDDDDFCYDCCDFNDYDECDAVCEKKDEVKEESASGDEKTEQADA